ncbi:MAG: hypothetical protein ACQEP8_00035 [Chlamydiota bacterium]
MQSGAIFYKNHIDNILSNHRYPDSYNAYFQAVGFLASRRSSSMELLGKEIHHNLRSRNVAPSCDYLRGRIKACPNLSEEQKKELGIQLLSPRIQQLLHTPPSYPKNEWEELLLG